MIVFFNEIAYILNIASYLKLRFVLSNSVYHLVYFLYRPYRVTVEWSARRHGTIEKELFATSFHVASTGKFSAGTSVSKWTSRGVGKSVEIFAALLHSVFMAMNNIIMQ